MRVVIASAALCLAFSTTVFAKDDHHECEEALGKLEAASQQAFTNDSHHEHQQAKEAHQSGDFKKCADQANKALSHMKKN